VIKIHKTECFVEGMARLHDIRARAKIAARIDWMALGGPADVVSAGPRISSKLRIHYGPGYQVYFTRRAKLIVLWCCCDNHTEVMFATALPVKSEPAS
jgi:putative addiction module killer protein